MMGRMPEQNAKYKDSKRSFPLQTEREKRPGIPKPEGTTYLINTMK
jgi:hypothetical protein